MRIAIHEFLQLRKQLPVVDVRSEGEFRQGHIPNANNIPVLNNDERKLVGTDYKQQGQLHAIKTGFRLVGPRLPDIIESSLRLGPELIVHCWRGGMRSGNFCRFVEMAGQKTFQLDGGYKAYRQLATESFAHPLKLVVLGGHTGSGKSEVLRALAQQGEQVIDLETLANHKGSAFGGLMMPEQPTTEQFQNALFESILSMDRVKNIWIEDESLAIGRIYLPETFWSQINSAPIVELQVSKPDRIRRLVEEYGGANPEEFLSAMERISKRLGGQHFKAAKEKYLAGDLSATIDILLTYYDKAYGYGLNVHSARIRHKVGWSGHDALALSKELRTLVIY